MTVLSIRQRLVLTLGLSAVAVFAVVGGILYWALAHQLEQADRDGLAGKVRIVRHFIDETRSGSVDDLRHHIDDVLIGHGELRVWLLDAQRRVTVGDPALPTVVQRMEGVLRLVHADGTPMEGLEVAVDNAGPLPVATMLVAIDIRPRLRLLAAYLVVLVAACTVGVLASIGLAAWSTRRGLQPLVRLSAEATAIAPASLSVRLRDDAVDPEVHGLVRAFNAALDRVEQAYRRMEAFNADVAHELRTPLASLINAAQVTLSSRRPLEELEQTLAQQLDQLEEMKGMVNDMLFLARADRGESAAVWHDLDLRTEARKALDYFEAALADASITAQLIGDARSRGDAGLVRRALSNLLSNAIKHTPRGGTIELRLRRDGDEAIVEVYNPGEPIPEAVRIRMFDRFFRADGSRQHSGESVGLGLSIVRAIAVMHRGSVFVQSEANGNTVGLRLPI